MIICLFIFAIAQAEVKKDILVSAAASLKEAFTEMGHDFEGKNNVKVSFNFAASGQLKAQIEGGAPVDVFASAALADMDALEKKGLIEPNSKENFAKNVIVLAQNVNSKIQIKKVEELAKPETFGKIAMGNPDTVPAGRYAKESLTFYKVFDSIKDKLVFGENVRQVLDYISRNEVDAGFVFLTDALTDKNVRKVLELPENSHKPIIYPIAVIKASKNLKISKEFIKFSMSHEGKAILKKYGFR